MKSFTYLILIFLISSCSNTEKIKDNKIENLSEAASLEKSKQSKKDSLENLKNEIIFLKKKRDSIISANKENLEKNKIIKKSD